MAQSDGFQKHPENINKKGRPHKDESLTHLMREYLLGYDEKEDKTGKDAFIAKVYDRAMKGDATCIKLIWNYLEGMPKQELLNVNINNPIAEWIKNLENKSEATPDNQLEAAEKKDSNT